MKIGKDMKKVEVTADSGAADMVGPPETAEDVPIQENDASRKGQYYVAANGERIYNQGEKKIQVYS